MVNQEVKDLKNPTIISKLKINANGSVRKRFRKQYARLIAEKEEFLCTKMEHTGFEPETS